MRATAPGRPAPAPASKTSQDRRPDACGSSPSQRAIASGPLGEEGSTGRNALIKVTVVPAPAVVSSSRCWRSTWPVGVRVSRVTSPTRRW
jgi:hypothetical protein